MDHRRLDRTRCIAIGTAITALLCSPAASQDVHELTFSTYLPPAYEYVWSPIEQFVETLERESQGRLKVNVFHSGQLFGGYEELEAVSRGDIDITNMTGTYPSGTVEALKLFTLPFVFESVGHMQRSIEGGLLDLGIRDELRDQHDVVVLGVAPWDPYEFYTRNEPIETVEDFQGKVWATTGETDARAVQLLGGSPTSMSSADLYLSFERGVIDGTPRPLLTGIGRSLYEVVSHITLTNFAIDTSILAINRAKWDALPEDLQQIISDAAVERDRLQFEMVQAFTEDAISRYEELGVEVRRMDEADVAKLRDATSAAVDEWVAAVESGERYLEIIEAVR